MKMKFLLLLIVVAGIAATAGWFVGRRDRAPKPTDSAAASGTIYSCSMHPQIRSTKPGKCTICGMDLAPIGSGQSQGADGTVMLGSNVINVIHVQTAEARRGKLTRTLRVAGTIDDDDTRHRFVSAYVDGRVDRLFVNYVGAEVTQGQPLAIVYSPMLLAAEQEYLLLVGQATNAATTGDYQRLITVAEQRLRRLGLTDAQIKQLGGKPSTNLHTQILASMSGTVVQRRVYEGQYVKEGDNLFEIADFSTMWFKFDAYERDLAWLKPGQIVEVTAPSVPGKVYRAPIAFIDPNLNDMTRSAKVRVELQNPLITRDGKPQRELLHRTYAEGVVKVEIEDVLTVPRSAVLAAGRRALVYVEKENALYEQRPVKLGRAGDNGWEILEGLSDGERVVTSGNMLIDAQAQLNQGGSAEPAGSRPEFNEHQHTAVRDAVTVAHELAAALAADNVDGFNAVLGKIPPAVQHLTAVFSDTPEWKSLVDKIAAASKFEATQDLKAARKMFQPFAAAVVELGRAARQQPAFASIKVFKCPMTDQAYPGAPKSAMWIQTNAPLRNPFFGGEMIDCGNEVR